MNLESLLACTLVPVGALLAGKAPVEAFAGPMLLVTGSLRLREASDQMREEHLVKRSAKKPWKGTATERVLRGLATSAKYSTNYW